MIIPKTNLYNNLVSRKDVLILIVILIPSFLLRLYRLDFHNGETVFDERAYYQKASLSYLQNQDDPNFEHPPLGKEILALGIKIFGDNPYGWRIPSLIFSLLGNIIIYFLFKDLFKSRFVGGLTSAFLSLDFMYFIHSRLGTMEMFYLFFLWGSVYFLYKFICIDESIRNFKLRYLIFGSVFFGLAFGTKWAAGLILIPFFIILIWQRKFFRLIQMGVLLTIITTAIYIGAYFPYIKRNSFNEFLGLQLRIIDYWKTFSKKTPPLNLMEYFLNHAFAWPLNPAWNYDLVKHEGGVIQVVWAMYNPILFFPAMFYFIKHAVFYKLRKMRDSGGFITLVILAAFVPWLFISRVQYTYYLLPAIPFLYSLFAFRLMDVFAKDRWLFSSVALSILAVFCYFYPLISNLPVPPQYLTFYPLSVENSTKK